ncbi:hypothetical protein Hanom_Chr05g00444401 [Helianthus anomalus]
MIERPTVTQMQLETSVGTPSQQIQTSQPVETLHISSQRDSVVRTREPHNELDDSLKHIFSSPFPEVDSLSTSPPINILTTIKPSCNCSCDLNKASSSQSPITKSIHPQVTRSTIELIANPQVDEGTPFVSQVTLAGFSSEATTTTIGTTVSQLDSAYIAKTSLKAATIESTIVYPLTVGSPQNQEQGAFGSKPNTTTSGRNLDDPINLGDGLRYQELTERVTKKESSIDEIKEIMKTLVQNSRTPPTNVEISREI